MDGLTPFSPLHVVGVGARCLAMYFNRKFDYACPGRIRRTDGYLICLLGRLNDRSTLEWLTAIAALPTLITLESGRLLNLAWKVADSQQIGFNIQLIPPITKRDYWSLNLFDHT
ncbi:MAG: hypothetical protein K9K38_15265 [Rhodoferax sp.]|nr:hypothetical protein [Rhodoferax sp.]MCF8210740.1 hypothetical protein [Rhodoferax sp.]